MWRRKRRERLPPSEATTIAVTIAVIAWIKMQRKIWSWAAKMVTAWIC